MPEFDVLEFDYSSGRRPPAGAKRVDDNSYNNILVGLHCSECSPADQIHALQQVSHQMFITSMQLRGLLGLYKEPTSRLDLCVLWFAQIMDWHNEKVFRVRFEKQEELCCLRDRLGWVTLFPSIQLEQAVFKINFACYEQRVVGAALMYISARESPANLRNVKYVHEDGKVDPLETGLPRSWEELNKAPPEGVLSVSYVCAPEERNFQVRKQFHQQYGYRKLDANEDDVMWWAALHEAPPDVLTFLQWIMARFQNPKDCFLKIDGPDGNGVISLREFEDAFRDLDCQIFRGDGEKRRINDIFRYLDPSGEGQVSLGEWAIMDMLSREIKTSITEFVQFCTRTFGDNLINTWNFMDADGGGEIDCQEWCDACAELGYFGPTEPIFRHLDADNEGTVSIDEFEKLEDFKVDEVKRIKRKSTLKSIPSGIMEELVRPSSRQSGREGSSSEATSSRPGTSEAESRPLSRNNTKRKSSMESGQSGLSETEPAELTFKRIGPEVL